MASGGLFYKQIKFEVDGFKMGRNEVGDETGNVVSSTLGNPEEIVVDEVYNVVEQPVPGYKTITQATEPPALKRVAINFFTFIPDDFQFFYMLTNTTVHEIKCSLLLGVLPVYLIKKNWKQEHGWPEYQFYWQIEFLEANDNN